MLNNKLRGRGEGYAGGKLGWDMHVNVYIIVNLAKQKPQTEDLPHNTFFDTFNVENEALPPLFLPIIVFIHETSYPFLKNA